MPKRLWFILLLTALCVAPLMACAEPSSLPSDRLRYFWLGQEKLLSQDSPEAAIAQVTLEEALTKVIADSGIVYSDTQFEAKMNGYPRFDAVFAPPRRFATGKGSLDLTCAALVAEPEGMTLLISPAHFTGWQVYPVQATMNTQHLLASIRDTLSEAIAIQLLRPTPTASGTQRTLLEATLEPNPDDIRLALTAPVSGADAPLLAWSRREADRRCDRLMVWMDGSAQYGRCEGDTSDGMLPATAMETLQCWRSDLAPFSFQHNDVVHGLYFEMAWFGHGSRQPNSDDVAMIFLWSSRLHNILQQP